MNYTQGQFLAAVSSSRSDNVTKSVCVCVCVYVSVVIFFCLEPSIKAFEAICFKGVTRVFQGCLKDVSRVFQPLGCFMCV